MENVKTKSVGQIVADDFRTATVFQKYGIDFCCNGNITIEQACDKKHVDVEQLLENLDVIRDSEDQSTDYQSWPLDLLADYIEKTHHRYIEEVTPALLQFLNKLCKVHGQNHPELIEINEEFKASAGELAAHMKKEELMLFPFIRKMVSAKKMGQHPGSSVFGSVSNPIEAMMQEHDVEGNRFKKITELSNGYTLPQDACNTYQVAFKTLKEFENDLHKHIHLENNILFPKAIELEKEFS